MRTRRSLDAYGRGVGSQGGAASRAIADLALTDRRAGAGVAGHRWSVGAAVAVDAEFIVGADVAAIAAIERIGVEVHAGRPISTGAAIIGAARRPHARAVLAGLVVAASRAAGATVSRTRVGVDATARTRRQARATLTGSSPTEFAIGALLAAGPTISGIARGIDAGVIAARSPGFALARSSRTGCFESRTALSAAGAAIVEVSVRGHAGPVAARLPCRTAAAVAHAGEPCSTVGVRDALDTLM